MTKQLEERVALLEAEVARLKNKLEGDSTSEAPWWEKILGTFENNAAYDEAMQLGHEYRTSSLRSNSAHSESRVNALAEDSIRSLDSLHSKPVELSDS